MFSELGITFLYVKFRIIPGQLAQAGSQTLSVLNSRYYEKVGRMSHPCLSYVKRSGLICSLVRDCFKFTVSDKARSGNKMPTRCNRDFYCRSYCLLNMFRAPLCPSSGAQEYYTVVAACGISCCGFQVAGLVWSWRLCVRFAECCSILQTGHITRSWWA